MPWTETTSAQYRRESLRYASDLTDTEWSLVAAHLPAARCWDDRGRSSFAMSWTRSCISRRPAASRDSCRKISRPIRWCRGISTLGATRDVGGRSITPWSWRREGRMAARRVRRDRQPIRENLRKRRSARIDAGKKIMGRKRHIVPTPRAISSASSSMPPTSRIATALR